MNPRAAPVVLLAGVAVALALGVTGKMPHEWFGISTETLIGWAILLAVPAVFFVMLLVIMDRQKQLRRGQAWMNRRLDDLEPKRGRVVKGPWERSG